MRCLRVLITNNTLGERAGSELYVRDLATSLLERGHTPIAYSSLLGEVADEIRRATVPVVQDLDALGEPPDVIHGQHHVETMTALLRFPDVPAVYFCHGWLPWEELPLRFPRILCYVAVDHTCRDRLVYEAGIPEEQVRVLLNFVDLDRFRPRPPLPQRPRRGLVFSNGAGEGGFVTAVREACARAGLILDVIGRDAGTPCSHPEELLGGYDLVFAKGRAALEALATGTAVILCDHAGTGPLVTSAEMERLRLLNFGLRALRRPHTAEALFQEIGRYDAEDAAKVSRWIRATAGRDQALDQLVGLYHEVVDTYARQGECDRLSEARAAAAYLRSVSPVFQQRSAQPLRQECAHLRAERDQLGTERDHFRTERTVLISERDHLNTGLDRLRAERDHLLAERAHLLAEQDRLNGERERLLAEMDRLIRERAAPETERACLFSERDRLLSERNQLEAERDQLRAALADLHDSITLQLSAAALRVPVLGRAARGTLRGLRKLGRWLVRPPHLSPMPIIVGVARSGTTLLRLMLDAHPDLAIPAETGFIPAVHELRERGTALRLAFFETVTGAPTWPDLCVSKKAFWRALLRIEPFDVASGLRCFYATYAQRFGKRRWGDKTPMYGRHLRVIEAVLPEAHFLHILRDGRDVALSLRGLWFAPGDTIEALAIDWRDQIAVTREQGTGCRRYLEVRYEDLVTNTGSVLQQICRFLELPFSEQMEAYHHSARSRLDEVRTRYDSDGSVLITKDQRLQLHRLTQQPPNERRIGRWKSDMSRAEQVAFEGIAGELLRSLGYETVTHVSASSLRPAG